MTANAQKPRSDEPSGVNDEPWPNGPARPEERTTLRLLGWAWTTLSLAAAALSWVANGRGAPVYALGGFGILLVLLMTSRPRRPR